MLIHLLCLSFLNSLVSTEDSGLQLTPCVTAALQARAAHQQFIPVCTPDGKYNPRQCTAQECWCVDTNGAEVAGSRQGLDQWQPCDGEPEKPTRCQADARRVSALSIPAEYVPDCDANGLYQPTQCNPSQSHCWCVTTDGHILAGQEMPPLESYPNCVRNPTPCWSAAQNAGQGTTLQCNGVGEYNPLQCDGENCWCVDSNGNTISGTRAPQSSPPKCGPCAQLDCEATGACHAKDGACVCFNGASPPFCDPCEGKACAAEDFDAARKCTPSLQSLGHCTCQNGADLDTCAPGPCDGLTCQQDGTCKVQDGACVCLNGALPPNCVPQTCATAWPLTCNSWVTSQPWLNTALTAKQGSYPCNTVDHSAPQGWYTLTLANDAEVDFFQCTTAGFHTRISVFSGSCSSPQCAAAVQVNFDGQNGNNGQNGNGQDTGLTCGTALRKRLAAGEYHVMVHGTGKTVGSSALWAACDPCGGFACQDTQSCSPNGPVCQCLNGLQLPDCDACAGKPCAERGDCTSYAGECTCKNNALPENDCLFPDAPSNDECANGTPIKCGSHVSGTLFHAKETPSCSRNGSDVWYTLSVTEKSTVSISMCKGRNFDSYMVLMNNCDDDQCVMQNDDSRHCGSGSTISANLNEGTYHVMVREYAGQFAGQSNHFVFNLDVTCIPMGTNPCANQDCYAKGQCFVDGAFCTCENGGPLPYCDACFDKSCYFSRTCRSIGPACKCTNGGAGDDCYTSLVPKNDECSGALPIRCGSQTLGTTKYASSSGWDKSNNPDYANSPDVWYVLDLSSRTLVNLSICDSKVWDKNFDPALALLGGTCGSPSVIQTNEDTLGCGNDRGAFISRWLDAGRYYAVVRGYRTVPGKFQLDVNCGLAQGASNAYSRRLNHEEEMSAAPQSGMHGWKWWLAGFMTALVALQAAAIALRRRARLSATEVNSGVPAPLRKRHGSLAQILCLAGFNKETTEVTEESK